METKTLNIPSISCGHCVATIKRELSPMAGVQQVDGDVATKQITVTVNSPEVWAKIEKTLDEIGYPVKQ